MPSGRRALEAADVSRVEHSSEAPGEGARRVPHPSSTATQTTISPRLPGAALAPDVILPHLARDAAPGSAEARVYAMAEAIWRVCKRGAECDLDDLAAAGFPEKEAMQLAQLAMAVLTRIAPIPCRLALAHRRSLLPMRPGRRGVFPFLEAFDPNRP